MLSREGCGPLSQRPSNPGESELSPRLTPRTPGAPVWDCPEPGVWGEERATPEHRCGVGGGQAKPCSVRSVPRGKTLGGWQLTAAQAEWEAGRRRSENSPGPSWSRAGGMGHSASASVLGLLQWRRGGGGGPPCHHQFLSGHRQPERPCVRPLPAFTEPGRWTHIPTLG